MDLNEIQLTQMQEIEKRWRDNPEAFILDCWGVELWDKLSDVAQSLKNNSRTVVPSAHGVGKTWLSARLALWFLYSFYPSKIITTAPTWPQVETLLWGEIRQAHDTSRIPLGGDPKKTKLELSPEWFARGLSTQEGSAGREFGATKFQGFHSKNLLVIFDEAPGVRSEIWTAAESLIVAENNKMLAIGNPTSPSGHFYDACRSPIWNKVHINAFDHPNVKAKRELIPGAVTMRWIEDRKTEWGEGTPLYIAKVLGDFPDEGDDTLIPLSWAEAASQRRLEAKGTFKLGCDVARYGEDKTIIYRLVGPVATLEEEMAKSDTMTVTGRLVNAVGGREEYVIGVDDASMGGGVTDRLEELEKSVDAINFGSKAIDPERFLNVRAEALWLLRERLKPDSDDPLQIPDDPELIHQLTSMKFGYTSKGQIKIESKDDMKKRGLKSPDKADALAIANYAGRRHKEPNITIL